MKTRAILLALLLAGCYDKNQDGMEIVKSREVCLNGVVYYRTSGQYDSNLAPKFNRDGSLEICSMEAADE